MNPEQISIDKDLLLSFFLTFSGFEFALKNTRFKREARHGGAEPDWQAFIETVSPQFNKEENEELLSACRFFIDDPPRRQVIAMGDLAWETQTQRENESEAMFILRMVKSVRNNLFHGGKHNIGLHEDPSRVSRLLQNSIVILNYVAILDHSVSTKFNEARI